MSYTVYHTYENNTSRPANNISRLASTCKSDFCEAPTEMLGDIQNIHAENSYVLYLLSINLNLH